MVNGVSWLMNMVNNPGSPVVCLRISAPAARGTGVAAAPVAALTKVPRDTERLNSGLFTEKLSIVSVTVMRQLHFVRGIRNDTGLRGEAEHATMLKHCRVRNMGLGWAP